jgi:hypothetical protein
MLEIKVDDDGNASRCRPSTARQHGAGHAHGSGGEDSARGRTAQQEQGTPNHPVAEAEGSPLTRLSPSKRSRTRAKGHKSDPAVAAPAPAAATLAAAPVHPPLPALGPGSLPAGTARDAAVTVEGRVEFGFNIITVHHWDRLLGEALLAPKPRVPWATLLRRTFEMDVTRCPRCHSADARAERDHGARDDPKNPRSSWLASGPAHGETGTKAYVERGPSDLGRRVDASRQPTTCAVSGALSGESGGRGPPAEAPTVAHGVPGRAPGAFGRAHCGA